VQLARELWNEDLESGFVDRLAQAKSNIVEHADRPRHLRKICQARHRHARHGGCALRHQFHFESYPVVARLYAFSFHQEDRQMFTAGAARLALGRARSRLKSRARPTLFRMESSTWAVIV